MKLEREIQEVRARREVLSHIRFVNWTGVGWWFLFWLFVFGVVALLTPAAAWVSLFAMFAWAGAWVRRTRRLDLEFNGWWEVQCALYDEMARRTQAQPEEGE